MQLTQEELDVINNRLVENLQWLYELEKCGSVGVNLKHSYCWGYEDLYFKILELAGYNQNQRLDMYHKQLLIARGL